MKIQDKLSPSQINNCILMAINDNDLDEILDLEFEINYQFIQMSQKGHK